MGDELSNLKEAPCSIKQSPISISNAVARLKSKGLSISKQRIYQYVYTDKLFHIQNETFAGSGRTRPGGRLLVDWNEVEKMFVHGER